MRLIIDIETTMDHKKIHVAVTRNIDTNEVLVWKEATALRDYLKAATLLVGHNIVGFDAPVMRRLWAIKIAEEQMYDTLVVSRLLEPSMEGGHNLEAWGVRLGTPKMDYAAAWEVEMGRVQAYKGECFDSPTFPLLNDYCTADVLVTHKLYTRLVEETTKRGFSEESSAIEHQVAQIIGEQERNGFKLDQAAATLLLAEITQRMGGIQDAMQERWPPVVTERFHKKTGKRLKDSVLEFNPGSRQQIGEKLKELGWVPEGFTVGGQPTVDEGVLLSLKFPEAKIIADYLMCQKRVAQISSWLEAVGADGRIRGKVITNGAVTGRMSHYSPNMAQIPNASSEYGSECRACFVVEDGNVLVGIDAAGLELRMLAHYMKDEAYALAVAEGDVHTLNQQAAGLATRDQAKTFIYAFLYGAGSSKIGSIAGGGAKAGKALIDSFLSATPALSKLRKSVATHVPNGFLPGLDGRKITIRSEHAALNTLLQGAGAVVMKQALIFLNNEIKKQGWMAKFVANVHDEFQVETKPELAELVGQAGVASIIKAGQHFKMRCPLDGNYKVGINWKETH